ncbi:hypothetical protein B0J17DRAFT_676577 [Rhizoctonia solani]|nr:hypothetical protein B0J17DRAFT_676577 [Rhizoctonia solani]
MVSVVNLIRELQAASEQLEVAVERYHNACRTIRESYLEAKIIRDVPQELLTYIHHELPRVSSCNKKVLQAKAAICQTRNCSSQIVSIHGLPTEVLTRIFQIVVGAQWCDISGYRTTRRVEQPSGSYPDQPVVISHVCSYWRQIIISSSALWSHVDFSFPDITNDPQSIPRLVTSVSRSGQSLLDVHIDASDYFNVPTTIDEMNQFITLVGPRTKSLELEVGLHMYTGTTSLSLSFCRSVLNSCFAHCVPGVLRQLSLLKRGNHYFYQAIEPADKTRTHESMLLDLPERQLESLWGHINVLRLQGLCPPWNSRIYRGLVELRLPSAPGGSITEREFVAILESSPGLRILEFGLDVTTQSPAAASKKPVSLVDLEILITGPWPRSKLSHFHGLIAPGSKPLCVSVINPNASIFLDEAPALFDYEIKKFFARSNLTSFGVTSINKYTEILELLDLVPQVRVLGLTGCNCEELDEGLKTPPIPMNIDTVYLLHECYMELSTLKHLVQTYRVKTIIFWGDNTIESTQNPVEKETLEMELKKHCSTVEFRSTDEPNPFEGHEWY